MTENVELAQAEYRLARHYLNKLRRLNDAIRRGRANASYAVAEFDLEWDQIKRWQNWTCHSEADDAARALLCIEFPVAGLEILSHRINASEHITWLQAALIAAERLHDLITERRLLYELQMAYYRVGSVDMIKEVATQLLQRGEEASDHLAIERALFGLAAYSEERGLYADSQQYLQRALDLAMPLKDVVEIGRILNALGSVALHMGECEDASDYFRQYLDLMESHGEVSKVCHALLSLGECLISQRAYDDAERHLQRAVSLCRTLAFQRLLGVGLLTLGMLAVERDSLAEARTYLVEGLDVARTVGVQRQIVQGLATLGYVELRSGGVENALPILQEGLRLAREGGRPRSICEMQIHLTYAHLATRNVAAARNAVSEALASAQHIRLRPQQTRAIAAAVAYAQLVGALEKAATCAGVIVDDVALNEPFFTSTCAGLMNALGANAYNQAIAAGRMHTIGQLISEILAWLSQELQHTI
jgi:tetratricopeptide (TPR) repeat protein